jgi:hypothetical protein
LTQLGYAVFFIGHASEGQEEDENGNSHMVIRPAIPGKKAKQTIEGMADIYGYAH